MTRSYLVYPAVGCHYFPPCLRLPSQPPLVGRYQIILLGDRGAFVRAACPRLEVDWPRLEPWTFWVAIERCTVTAHCPLKGMVGYSLVITSSHSRYTTVSICHRLHNELTALIAAGSVHGFSQQLLSAVNVTKVI